MSEFLFRRNTVLEALRGSRRELIRLWLQKDARHLKAFTGAAKKRAIPFEMVTKGRLSEMAGDSSHQGVLLQAGPYPYCDVTEILNLATSRAEKPFLLLLDLIHGPQNIGTLLRTAEACGVHGIIVQDRRAPEITPHVVMYSAGAAEHLLITQVTNLVQTMRQLKAAGIWMVGLDLDHRALPLDQVDLDMALGIVVGHEGTGLRRLVRQSCDYLLKLPMRGQVASLNAATAGSVLLYAAWGARDYEGSSSEL
jgi:23S rRNA (guanosine2251-2'-O)-methyltransferase